MSGGQLLCKVSLASVGYPKFAGVKDHLAHEGVAAWSGRPRLFASRTLEALIESVPLNSPGVSDVVRGTALHLLPGAAFADAKDALDGVTIHVIGRDRPQFVYDFRQSVNSARLVWHRYRYSTVRERSGTTLRA